jgi:hypothetical protein
VPSGLPRTIEKIQKNAAVHAKRRITILNNGDRTRTKIEAITAYISLGSDMTDC